MIRFGLTAFAAFSAISSAQAETWQLVSQVLASPRENGGPFEYITTIVDLDARTNPGTFRLTLTGDAPPDSFSLERGSLQFWRVCCGNNPQYRLSPAGGVYTVTSTGFEFVYTPQMGVDVINGQEFPYYTQGDAIVRAQFWEGTNGQFTVERLVADIPEPATWAMMISGFACVGGALRARRAKASLA